MKIMSDVENIWKDNEFVADKLIRQKKPLSIEYAGDAISKWKLYLFGSKKQWTVKGLVKLMKI